MVTPSTEWRITSPGGIKYRFEKQTGTFSYENAEVTAVFIIDSYNLLALVTEMFPGAIILGGSFYYPQPPGVAGLSTLIPKKLDYEGLTEGGPTDPFGADSGAPAGTYEPYLRVTVTFGPRPENSAQQNPGNPETFLEVSLNAGGRFLSSPLPGGKASGTAGTSEWVTAGDDAADDTKVNEANIGFTVTETIVEWSVKWPRIPYAFWDSTLIGRLRDMLGKVNSSSIGVLRNAPANTILFLSFSATQNFTWRDGFVGTPPLTLSMNFVEKNFKSSKGIAVTHQHMYRPGFGWRKIKINDEFLFETANLNSIWS